MKNQCHVRDLVAELTDVDSQLAAACRTMTEHTHGLPSPRHLFSATFAAERFPARMLCTMMRAAIKAHAPLLDVLAPVRALEAWVRSQYPATLPSLPECQRAETIAQGQLDEAQMRAAHDPSRVNLERMRDAASRHLEALRTLYDVTAQQLVARRRPEGWAA